MSMPAMEVPATGASAAPGWYADPSGQAVHRYWNGAAWTADTMPPTVATKAYSGWLIATAWIVCLVTFGYMLPWAIAVTRSSDKTVGAGLVNLFTGWTIIGWIAALVMACV